VQRTREEEFQDVQLVVKGYSSIEQSLAGLTTFEKLEGDNQYAFRSVSSLIGLTISSGGCVSNVAARWML
jgi:hypothetical protein